MKSIAFVAGPFLAAVIGILLIQAGYSPGIGWTAAITIWIASWWVFEPIPIPATSLIPLAAFPMTGVLSESDVAAAYGHKLVLLMLGGFMLSAAMEKSGAHRRIALGMVQLFGGSNGKSLIFGFMAASAFLSMWISNAATTLMLLPIAMAVVDQTQNQRLQLSLLLGIAYAASVGGVGTPIGTPPNIVFISVLAEHTGNEFSFIEWMYYAMPIVVVMLPIVGLWLTRGLSKIETIKLPDCGLWRREEILTLLVFGFTALLWMTRQQPSGGWTGILGLSQVNDAQIGIAGAIVMFLIPNGNGGKLLDWDTAKKIPWGILILFAGGICIAKAFGSSGLSTELGNRLAGLQSLPVLLLIGVICLAVTFMTEVTSNTATTTLLMPILLAAAVAAEMDPKIFMIPATISASFAFMLPVATPP
ncbi:MAG: SLC13 family permease, partial [Planctomycetota bacterium]